MGRFPCGGRNKEAPARGRSFNSRNYGKALMFFRVLKSYESLSVVLPFPKEANDSSCRCQPLSFTHLTIIRKNIF